MAVDPYRSFNFALLIEGVSSASFVECSGLGADFDVIAYREAGANQQVRHLPGQIRYQPVILRYGVTNTADMWNWFRSGMNGQPDRHNVSIVTFENDGVTEAFRWNLFEAWVSSWQAAQLDASSNEVAIENMTVVYDRFERD